MIQSAVIRRGHKENSGEEVSLCCECRSHEEQQLKLTEADVRRKGAHNQKQSLYLSRLNCPKLYM